MRTAPGRWACRSSAAAPSASRSTRPTATASTPACVRTACGAATTAAPAGSMSRRPGGPSSRSPSAGRRRAVRRHRAQRPLPLPRSRLHLAGASCLGRASVPAHLELPAAAVDLARSLDRAQPARPGADPRGHRVGRPDAYDRRRGQLARPCGRRTGGRALTGLAPPRAGSRLRGGWRRRGVERRRRSLLAPGRRGPGPPLHLVRRRGPGRPRAVVPLRQHRAVRRARSRRSARSHLPAPQRRMGAAGRRATGAAAGDAVRPRGHGGAPARRPGRRTAVGERRSRRALDALPSCAATR